jgi:4-amino-4-deoxy-L-arabinose transferase-like glycosyltransferase
MNPSRLFAARLSQAILLGAPLAVLTLYVSRRLFPDNERASQIAAVIVALYPILLIYPVSLATENLFFLLLLASFLFLLACLEKPTITHFVVSGVFLGLTCLTRSVILPFVAAVFCLLFYLHGRRALPAVFAFVLVIAPWIIRNSLIYHKLTGIETSMGYNLYLGYHPEGNGSFLFGPSFDLLTILDDAERDRVGTQKALEFIRAQPERFVPLAIDRLGFFFGLEKRAIMYFYSNNLVGYIPPSVLLSLLVALLLPFVVVAVTAALGMSSLCWKPEHILLGLLFVFYILPHVLILSEDRFHLALVPCMAILAAQAWTVRFREIPLRWHESRVGKGLVMFCMLCVILLVVNWGIELHRDWDKILILLGPYGNHSYFPY